MEIHSEVRGHECLPCSLLAVTLDKSKFPEHLLQKEGKKQSPLSISVVKNQNTLLTTQFIQTLGANKLFLEKREGRRGVNDPGLRVSLGQAQNKIY